MPWVITNGHTFVCKDQNGQAATTPDVKKANTYKDRKSAAKNAICLPRSMKNLNFNPYYVEIPTEPISTNAQEVCQVKEQEHIKKTPAIIPQCDDTIDNSLIDIDAFIEQTSNFMDFVSKAINLKPALYNAIHKAELEIMDIEHAIEFSHCNVVGGYQWYKMLRDVRERRRKYKNTLRCIDILIEECPEMIGKQNFSNRYEGLKHQKYMPRALIELTDYFKEAGAVG